MLALLIRTWRYQFAAILVVIGLSSVVVLADDSEIYPAKISFSFVGHAEEQFTHPGLGGSGPHTFTFSYDIRIHGTASLIGNALPPYSKSYDISELYLSGTSTYDLGKIVWAGTDWSWSIIYEALETNWGNDNYHRASLDVLSTGSINCAAEMLSGNWVRFNSPMGAILDWLQSTTTGNGVLDWDFFLSPPYPYNGVGGFIQPRYQFSFTAISQQPPTVIFTFQSKSPVFVTDDGYSVNEVIIFDASKTLPNDGEKILKYIWDFGDGTHKKITTSPRIEYSYSRPGTYTVTCEAVGKHGLRGKNSQTLKICWRQGWYMFDPKTGLFYHVTAPDFSKPVVILLHGWQNSGKAAFAPFLDLAKMYSNNGIDQNIYFYAWQEEATARFAKDARKNVRSQVEEITLMLFGLLQSRTADITLVGHSYGGGIIAGVASGLISWKQSTNSKLSLVTLDIPERISYVIPPVSKFLGTITVKEALGQLLKANVAIDNYWANGLGGFGIPYTSKNGLEGVNNYMVRGGHGAPITAFCWIQETLRNPDNKRNNGPTVHFLKKIGESNGYEIWLRVVVNPSDTSNPDSAKWIRVEKRKKSN